MKKSSILLLAITTIAIIIFTFGPFDWLWSQAKSSPTEFWANRLPYVVGLVALILISRVRILSKVLGAILIIASILFAILTSVLSGFTETPLAYNLLLSVAGLFGGTFLISEGKKETVSSTTPSV